MYKINVRCVVRASLQSFVLYIVDYEVFRRLQAYFVGFLYLNCFVFLYCILYLLFCNFGAFHLTGTVHESSRLEHTRKRKGEERKRKRGKERTINI